MEQRVAVRMTSVLLLQLMAAGCVEGALRPSEPCGAPDVSRSVQIRNVDKVDVLFVIDNSASMADDREKLREQVPRLARTLVTGSRGPDDPKPSAPVRDLHIAVVNSDMGAEGVEGCSEYGADGLFQSAPQGSACTLSDTPFLSYLALDDANPSQLANDVACVADVGAQGCSREQPLEAALKGLWPASDSRLQFTGELSHGDGENKGFLRNDPRQGLSLYAVVVLSDEDDASPFPISRYVEGFRALRGGNERLALFSAIVSVPPELVDAAARSGVDFGDATQREAYYDRISNDPRMQRVPDTRAESPEGSPGRRYIELAKALGPDARVASLRQDDYSPALDGIRDIVDLHLDAICLEAPLSRDVTGMVACNMIWELPPERSSFDTPVDCGDRPALLTSLPGLSDGGGKRCLVKQLAAGAEVSKDAAGWYYDGFSTAIEGSCAPGTRQRVAFTKAAVPPTGVTITVNCWSQPERVDCAR